MKIAPLKVSDPWYGRIVNDTQIHADSLSAVPIESTVDMELVELLHAGPEGNYRPYLHLRGELIEAIPAVELPYGVSSLTLRRGAGLSIDAFYDFTQQQLADLVAKGYFSGAFKVPDDMSGQPWVLPGRADFLVVAPALSDEPPVVFMNVHDQNSLELDQANSGYELAGYFPDYSAEPGAQTLDGEAQVDTIDHAPVADAQDVFAGIDVEAGAAAEAAPRDTAETDLGSHTIVPDGVFSRLVSEIKAKQPVEQQPETEQAGEDEVEPGSAWDVYLNRVAPGVEHVLSGEHVIEEAPEEESETVASEAEHDDGPALTDEGFVDLGLDETGTEELSGERSEAQPAALTADDHRLAAERRNARLRAELAADQTGAIGDEAQRDL